MRYNCAVSTQVKKDGRILPSLFPRDWKDCGWKETSGHFLTPLPLTLLLLKCGRAENGRNVIDGKHHMSEVA